MSPSVVVAGGGYAGSYVAKSLDNFADVTLVDPRDAFVNYSASLRATVRPDWADKPFFAYAPLLERGQVVRGTVISADPAGVTLDGGRRLDADYLVLATGSRHCYPAHPRDPSTDAAQAAAELRETADQIARAERVLILGAGPVGLELAGEIREGWPDKRIVVLDPAAELLPGYLPEVREELRRQLQRLDVDVRTGTALTETPPGEPGMAATFTVTTDTGEAITADIWFRSFGAQVNTAYLRDGALVRLTERRTVPVDEHLNVAGYRTVYALGDIADLPDAKMATHAQTQAPVVVENIRAQLLGQRPPAVYVPAPVGRIFLPLGTRAGVGQLPHPEGGAMAAALETVIERKGTDLFTARMAERFTRSQ